MQALLAACAAGDEDIDAELSADATASKQRKAAIAPCAAPTAGGKAQAWAALVRRPHES